MIKESYESQVLASNHGQPPTHVSCNAQYETLRVSKLPPGGTNNVQAAYQYPKFDSSGVQATY